MEVHNYFTELFRDSAPVKNANHKRPIASLVNTKSPKPKTSKDITVILAEENRLEEIRSSPVVLQVGRFFSIVALSRRAIDCLKRIHDFFSDDCVEEILLPICDQTSTLSLRAMDWVGRIYSKEKNLILQHPKELTPINVSDDYQKTLDKWKRKLFDSFCRGTRVFFVWHGQIKVTTVAQLNFLHWAYYSGVLQYAQDHAKDIRQKMKIHYAKMNLAKKNAPPNAKRRRSEASKVRSQPSFIYRTR